MHKNIGNIFSLLCICLLSFIENAYALELRSTGFNSGAVIPVKYTCKGQNISPPLSWSEAPKTTQSYVFIIDDPDAPAGVWTHWVLFNISSEIHELKEGVKANTIGVVGVNSWKENNYGGPCPPDKQHRYRFKLYALDSFLDLPKTADKIRVEKTMQQHVLAHTELLGVFP